MVPVRDKVAIILPVPSFSPSLLADLKPVSQPMLRPAVCNTCPGEQSLPTEGGAKSDRSLSLTYLDGRKRFKLFLKVLYYLLIQFYGRKGGEKGKGNEFAALNKDLEQMLLF